MAVRVTTLVMAFIYFSLHIPDSSLCTNPTHSKPAFATKRITILSSCLHRVSSCLKPVSIPACQGTHPT